MTFRVISVVAVLASVSFLSACGGGSTSAPPIVVSVAPASALTVDSGQPTALSATVSPDTADQGVRWTVTCAAGVANCGTMAQATSAGGVTDNFQADIATSATQEANRSIP